MDRYGSGRAVYLRPRLLNKRASRAPAMHTISANRGHRTSLRLQAVLFMQGIFKQDLPELSSRLNSAAAGWRATRRRGSRAAGRRDCPVPGEPPAPVPHPLFALFYQVEIRHRQLLNNNPAPFMALIFIRVYSTSMAI
jgi:hypothetical protein